MIIQDDMPELECCNCGWMGDSSHLVGDYRCPDCDSDDLVNYDVEAEQDPWPAGEQVEPYEFEFRSGGGMMDYIRNKDGSLPSETMQYLIVTYAALGLFGGFVVLTLLTMLVPAMAGGLCTSITGAILFGSIFFGARIYMVATADMWFEETN